MKTPPFWGWPHISDSGSICVNDKEGLDYDPDDFEGVLGWLVCEAAKLLHENQLLSEDKRLQAFSDELEGYLKCCGAKPVRCDALLANSQQLYAEVRTHKERARYVSTVLRVNTGSTSTSSTQQEKLGFLDVSIQQLPRLRTNLDPEWRDEFLSRLDSSQYDVALSTEYRGLVLRTANSYGAALVLVYWGRKQKKDEWQAHTYYLQRQDRDYVIQRTGGSTYDRHVVIAGLGAIGSRVAEHLALAGVKKLTLVDHDKFSADNLGRHLLGMDAIGEHKITELEKHLKNRIPGLNISAQKAHINKFLRKGFPQGTDAIVLTTGNSPTERAIIRRAYQEDWPTLIVSASVEAWGLGGHAIAMRPGSPGCLECLYYDPDFQNPVAQMRTSLIAPGQSVTRQLTGCGAFTPYSSIDANRTAMLAVERVLDNLSGYSRWAGKIEQARQAGIQPSATYRSLAEARIPLTLEPPDYIQPECICCSN